MRLTPIIVLMTLLLATASNLSAQAVCPPARDILSGDGEHGQFAKSMWKLFEAEFRGTKLNDSILIFSGEDIAADKISVQGYFWWNVQGKVVACAKVDGEYLPAERRLFLRAERVSSTLVPLFTRFEAELSAAGDALSGTMTGFDRKNPYSKMPPRWTTTNPWAERGTVFKGSWHAGKIYPPEAGN